MHTISLDKKDQKDPYATSRLMFILLSAFEYFIDLMIAKSYLAKLTGAIGMSTALTGILSSFIMLGQAFSILAIFLSGCRPFKRWVVPLHLINDLFFCFLYFIPITGMSKTLKTVLFSFFLLVGYAIAKLVRVPRTNWMMSLVDTHKRGSFTAHLEMVSLVGSMGFTFAMSTVSDHFDARGQQNVSFILIGSTIFLLSCLHIGALLLAKEKPHPADAAIHKIDFKRDLCALLFNKNVCMVVLASVLWNVAHSAAVPFYGAYEIGELGFGMTAVALINAAYSITRTLVSPSVGRYADRTAFWRMLRRCFALHGGAFLLMVFIAPQYGGRYLYVAYTLISAVAQAGITNGLINLVYDYVPENQRIGTLALQQTFSGFLGFLTTLLVAIPVDLIQKNGNRVFGIPMYAQQAISIFPVIFCAILVLFLTKTISKLPRPRQGDESEEIG